VLQLVLKANSDSEKLVDSLIEDLKDGGVIEVVFEDGIDRIEEEFTTPIEVKGGVAGALLGPLPIGPKPDDGEEECGAFPGETCKLPRYPGAFDASTVNSESEFGDDITKDEVIVDVFC